MVGFADFDNNTYSVATYQNNKPVSLYGLKDGSTIFNNAFLKMENTTIKKQATSGCAEMNSIIRLANGKDSVIVKKAFGGGIECPGHLTFWQILGQFFSGIGGGISSAFDFLFGWISGTGDSSGYSAGGSFGTGGYSSWTLSDFLGNVNSTGVNNTGNGGATSTSWVVYGTPTQLQIQNYARSLDYYWLDTDYDLNSMNTPYNSYSDGTRDALGFRKMGQVYNYYNGNVQNYTNDIGNYYAIFIKNDGTNVIFLGATIKNELTFPNRGWTSAWGGIHASLSFSLAGLEHEYGHYLQAQSMGIDYYNKIIVPASLYNMATDKNNHRLYWTEVLANQLAIKLFGPNSDIARDPINYPR